MENRERKREEKGKKKGEEREERKKKKLICIIGKCFLWFIVIVACWKLRNFVCFAMGGGKGRKLMVFIE